MELQPNLSSLTAQTGLRRLGRADWIVQTGPCRLKNPPGSLALVGSVLLESKETCYDSLHTHAHTLWQLQQQSAEFVFSVMVISVIFTKVMIINVMITINS